MGFPDAVAKTLPNQSTAKKDFRSVPFFCPSLAPVSSFSILEARRGRGKGYLWGVARFDGAGELVSVWI